ncbi:hypothetical protein [Fulvivirga sediminis]|uniref:Lipoprotein n=1 Tax=Fulvivirga sediminis TaxID=2803949 RepID=A0A937JZJ1_9BACT|nr:hypothetical protein [Fulvivirga sediminis]MBL3656709.1 hypothetical protein [Fulvivirga sediminis]
MKKCRDYYFIVILLLFTGCTESVRENDIYESSIEQKAFNFFIDSLYLHRNIFPDELKNEQNMGELLLPNSIEIDSGLYLKNGFLGGFKMYVDSVVEERTQPFLGSVDLIYMFFDSIKRESKVLEKNYRKINDKEVKILKLPENVTYSNQKELPKDTINLLVQVRRHLSGYNDKDYVQISISKYYHPMFETYDLYFLFNPKGELISWFVN